MKKLILSLAILGFVGCSSAEKDAHDHADAAQAQAEEAVDQAKADVEKAAEEMKTEAEKAQADAEEAVDQAKADAEATAEEAKTAFGDYVGTESSKVTCTNGDDSRTIAVVNKDEGTGCGVVYNKFDTAKTVAVAEYNMDYCTQVQEKMKGNLEGAGFTCE